MRHRTWWLVIATLVLLGLALVVQEALRPTPAAAASGASLADGSGSRVDTAAGGPVAGAADRAHNAAIAEAVTTLHAYLAVLFKTDRSEADAYWLNGRPARTGESDLRTLDQVTGLRADNTRPEPLDTADVPESLEIPVRLRVGGYGPLRHYTGHYRMRRVGDTWRITSASIEPSPVQR